MTSTSFTEYMSLIETALWLGDSYDTLSSFMSNHTRVCSFPSASRCPVYYVCHYDYMYVYMYIHNSPTRRSVITPGVPTIAIEMLAPQGWEKFSHHVIAMRTFGASGPAKHVLPHFGFSAPKVAGTTVQVLKMFADQWKELGCQSVPPLATHMAARL